MFEGIHRGIVRDNLDPAKKFRVKVAIPSLGPADDNNAEFISPWYRVASPPGATTTYDIGELVLVAFGNMDDVNDGYVIGAIPRIDNTGDPKVPATAKGEDDKSTLGDMGFSKSDHGTDADGISHIYEGPQSAYQKENASPRIETKEKNGLREEFDASSGRWRILTKEGHQIELSAAGTTITGGNNTVTTAGRFMTNTAGDESKEVGYNRFTKVGKIDTYRAAYRKDYIGKLEQEITTEQRTIKLVSNTTIGGDQIETVGMSSRKAVGFTSSITALNVEQTAMNSRKTFICGLGVTPGGVGTADTETIINGGKSVALSNGNFDVSFLPFAPPLSLMYRVRIGTMIPATYQMPLLASPTTIVTDYPMHLVNGRCLDALVLVLQAITTFATALGEALATIAPPVGGLATTLLAAVQLFTGTVNLDKEGIMTNTAQFVTNRLVSE